MIINDICIFKNNQHTNNIIFNIVLNYLKHKSYQKIEWYINVLKSQSNKYKEYIININNQEFYPINKINDDYNKIKMKDVRKICYTMGIGYIDPDILYNIVLDAVFKIYTIDYIYKELRGIDILNKKN